MAKLEIAGWKQASCDDGPGIRSVLFLQGCSMQCPGCHNSIAQKFGEGVLLDIDEVVTFLLKNCHNKRITISGGEPLEQWNSLKELLHLLNIMNFEICIYTGWEKDMVPEEVFLCVDYVKCGSFDYELRSEKIHFVGSENQKMYKKDSNGYWFEINLSA